MCRTVCIKDGNFIGPACGSGNFLTETYLSMRRLENEIIGLLNWEQGVIGDYHNPIQVSISQLYGIEINDFAATVAKTALWIAESVFPKNELNYIMGNPPFMGVRLISKKQKDDVNAIFPGWKNAGNLDYVVCWYNVACWYKKAVDLMQGIRTASPTGKIRFG